MDHCSSHPCIGDRADETVGRDLFGICLKRYGTRAKCSPQKLFICPENLEDSCIKRIPKRFQRSLFKNNLIYRGSLSRSTDEWTSYVRLPAHHPIWAWFVEGIYFVPRWWICDRKEIHRRKRIRDPQKLRVYSIAWKQMSLQSEPYKNRVWWDFFLGPGPLSV